MRICAKNLRLLVITQVILSPGIYVYTVMWMHECVTDVLMVGNMGWERRNSTGGNRVRQNRAEQREGVGLYHAEWGGVGRE